MTDVAPNDSNAQAYSVSELAFALKRTLEDRYGFVRLRGELSKVTHHGNGHVYLTIKDDKSAIDGVVWKGNVRGLGVRPEHGLEVIVTGKITTYPAGSRYQIVIESMEAAGVGALLAQLERLKAKLHARACSRRTASAPALDAGRGRGDHQPDRGGDPRHPPPHPRPLAVPGAGLAGASSRATPPPARSARRSAASTRSSPAALVPRPDIIIVARGGGSVEDLWAFNDEGLARTVAEGTIPLISAVGHETDTTLIDFVSDRRAPTPTAAAEMATPVLAELRASDQRLRPSPEHLRRPRDRGAPHPPDQRRARPAPPRRHAGPGPAAPGAVRGLPRLDDLTAPADGSRRSPPAWTRPCSATPTSTPATC
jgi:exodeoxyribonuclease VII large subunit